MAEALIIQPSREVWLDGNAFIQYRLGGNFHRESTVFPGSTADQKATAFLSLSGIASKKKFKSLIKVNYMADKNELPQVDYTAMALTLSPNAPPLVDENGSLNFAPTPEWKSYLG